MLVVCWELSDQLNVKSIKQVLTSILCPLVFHAFVHLSTGPTMLTIETFLIFQHTFLIT